jgi:hypothetical protein
MEILELSVHQNLINLFQDESQIKSCEKEITFDTDLLLVQVRQATYVDFKNNSIVREKLLDTAEVAYAKAVNGMEPNIQNLKFLNPKEFVAGQFHTRLDQWKSLMHDTCLATTIFD